MCEYLAACLCIHYGCCTRVDGSKDDKNAVEPDSEKSTMANEVGGDQHRTYLLSPTARRQSVSDTERLLEDIRDLLRTTVHDLARLRREKDAAQQMANDWMIAAAVIDRLCCIVITFFFVAGSATLVVLLLVSSAH